MVMEWLREQWERLWFKPASPRNLGLCRLVFFGTIFLFYLPEDFSAWGAVSDFFWKPIGLFSWLHLRVVPERHLEILQLLWKTALGFSCIGLFTRVSVSVSFVLGIYLLGLPHNFGKIHHDDAILVFVFGIMALSRCADSCSLDRLILRTRSKSDESGNHALVSAEYTWPIRTIWLLMSLVFFSAGFPKIRQSGMDWISTDNMRILLIQHNYYLSDKDPLVPWGLFLAQYPRFCNLLAAAAIVFETGYPLALFSRAARWIVIPSAFFMLVS